MAFSDIRQAINEYRRELRQLDNQFPELPMKITDDYRAYLAATREQIRAKEQEYRAYLRAKGLN